MFSKSFRSNDIWLWAIFFFVLTLAVNYLLFFAYQHTVPGDAIWVQISNYCGTDTFKEVTTSLMIPLILAVMGGIFKIGSAVDERILSAQAARSKERLSCIEQTSKTWNKIYDLSTEVRYFKKGADYEIRIIDILKRLESLSNEAESVVNDWRFMFPNLQPENTDLFVKSFNFLLDPSTMVAHYIRFNSDKDEVTELQNSLGVIQDEVKALSHYNILNVIKMSADLLNDDLSNKERIKLKFEINSCLEALKTYNVSLDREIQLKNNFLPAMQGPEVEAFRKSAQKLEEWVRVNPHVHYSDFPEFKNFKDAFAKIPQRDFVNTWEVSYSMEALKHFTECLGLFGIESNIADRVRNRNK